MIARVRITFSMNLQMKFQVVLALETLGAVSIRAFVRLVTGMRLQMAVKRTHTTRAVTNGLLPSTLLQTLSKTYRVMADFSANDLSQVGYVHENGFSPVCTRMCLVIVA